MPRKTKNEEKELKVNTKAKKVANKKATSKAKVESKETAKKTTKKQTKKVAPKTATKKSTTKSSAVKKASSKSSTTKKTTKKSSSVSKTAKKAAVTSTIEYYDLPFRYNQTIVKILAQTPNILFIYWDISDKDRQDFTQKYGENFFNDTKPCLVITNETMNYTFEVEINDFANSWYLHVNDTDCKYKVELTRKFIQNVPSSTNGYVYITASNELELPNDHILFDKLGSSVFFRNIKTNLIKEKNISSLSFIQRMGKVYHIYDLYKQIYKDELNSDGLELTLPSSSSSSFI